MTSKEKLEKLDYQHTLDSLDRSIYTKTFKGSDLYILMGKDKVIDYFVSVQEQIRSTNELARVSMAYEELLQDVKKLNKELNNDK